MKTQTPTADAEQTSALTEAPAAPAKAKIEPVVMRSPHDVQLTQQALEHRVEELKSLSKKNTTEGYVREARTIDADVAAIEHAILPQFRSQREIAFVTTEALEKEVAAALRVFIFRAFDGLDDPNSNVTAVGIRNRRDRLVEALATRVTMFARDVADAAHAAGYQTRVTTSESLALGVIASLRVRAD